MRLYRNALLRDTLRAGLRQPAKTQFPGMRLRVAEEGDRLVDFTERGNLFGYLKGAEGIQPGDMIELGVSTTKDGNMRVQYRHTQTQQGAS